MIYRFGRNVSVSQCVQPENTIVLLYCFHPLFAFANAEEGLFKTTIRVPLQIHIINDGLIECFFFCILQVSYCIFL